MEKEKKYNYFYRIENKINGHYYYGIHSTDNLEDGYMGSGKRLKIAYQKYGIENFEKKILKYFSNRQELSEYESNFVSEILIEDNECYNIILGGEKFNTIGYTSCYDKLNNEMVLIKTNVYHNNERYISTNSETVTVQNIEDGNWTRISNSEFKENRNKYKTPTEGLVNVINPSNEIFLVDKNDERIKNGELKYLFSDRHHSEETKQKISKTKKKNNSQVGNKNSNYGKKWIYRINNDSIETISVKKELLDDYLNNGWNVGRKILKKYNYKNAIINNINIEQFKKDYENGFSIKELSEKYSLSYSYTYKILTRRNIKK